MCSNGKKKGKGGGGAGTKDVTLLLKYGAFDKTAQMNEYM